MPLILIYFVHTYIAGNANQHQRYNIAQKCKRLYFIFQYINTVATKNVPNKDLNETFILFPVSFFVL
jgi:hypothetical protein